MKDATITYKTHEVNIEEKIGLKSLHIRKKKKKNNFSIEFRMCSTDIHKLRFLKFNYIHYDTIWITLSKLKAYDTRI